MATNDKFNHLSISLNDSDRRRVAAGVELYCKRLESLEAAAEKLNRGETAQYHKEVEALRSELVDQLNNGGCKILPHHVPIIKQGLEYLVTNIRACKGTVKAIGQVTWVEELDKLASRVEADLIPKFDAQTSLELQDTAPEPSGDDEPVESLTDIAKRETEEAEKPAKRAKRSKKKTPLKVEK